MSSSTFYPYAHDFVVNDSTFTAVSGNQTNHYNEAETGLKLLYQKIAEVGAFHDSETRYPPPNCHPGTRAVILRDLSSWIKGVESAQSGGFTGVELAHDQDPSSTHFTRTEFETPIHWLYGPAGAGKSAIAQTLSERFHASHQNHDRYLAATFFFSRSSPERNNPRFLFSSIAYSLAIWGGNSDLRLAIDKVVVNNHAIFEAVIETQYRDLVVKPLHEISQEGWEKLPKVVVIDGLDECLGRDSQKRVLKTILDETTRKPLLGGKPHRSLRFLIASRPEPVIRDMLNQHCHITARTELSNDYSASKDIAMYLRDGFTQILKDHRDMMTHISLPWPSQSVIDELVQRASGQFIYATTVLKYVGDDYFLPNEQLELVMGLPVGDPEAFSDLDILYQQIMSSNRNWNRVVQILGTWLAIQEVTSAKVAVIDIIAYLCSLSSASVLAALQGMHSVLRITTTQFELLHKSFQDFLKDARRSQRYFIDVPMFHAQIAQHCLQVLHILDVQTYHRKIGSDHPITYILHHWLEHIHHTPTADALLWNKEYFHQIELCQVIRLSAKMQDFRHMHPVYHLLKHFHMYFKFLQHISQTSPQLQHQLCVLSSCFDQGFYIAGISPQDIQWLPQITGLFALWTRKISDDVPYQADDKMQIAFSSFMLQNILNEVTICHPDFHMYSNHNPHLEDPSWYFIDLSKGHELLVRFNVRLFGTLSHPSRIYPQYLQRLPHDPSLICKIGRNIESSFLYDEGELGEIILWLQGFTDSWQTEANRVIAKCHKRIEILSLYHPALYD